jgi:phosphatidylethanolamine-binding protein (PEBP) family uncharacterized protein
MYKSVFGGFEWHHRVVWNIQRCQRKAIYGVRVYSRPLHYQLLAMFLPLPKVEIKDEVF